jgi:hypothetical protein
VSFSAEARSIQYSAQARCVRVVKLGQIIFFSTASGDAWMLEPEDGCAVCLAREGEPGPIPIQETDTRLVIEWNADYRVEGETFTVTERGGGQTQTLLDCPKAEIERLIREYPSVPSEDFPAAEAAQACLKAGRNDPCRCGSGRKYKKCCLPNDEACVRQAAAARQTREVRRAELFLRSVKDAPVDWEPTEIEVEPEADESGPGQAEFSPEVEAELEGIWEDFDAPEHPTTEQMDAVLTRLLALPPNATEWTDVMHRFARAGHGDLAGVFRRISDAVPATKGAGMGFFYWAAAEEFVRHGLSPLLPEVAEVFQKLDLHSYDADALTHVEDILLAEGYEAETLQLAEHFLAIEREDNGLMPYAVPDRCGLIFELRVGRALRGAPTAATSSQERIIAQLRQGIEEEIHLDAARVAAGIITGQSASSEWTRAQFELVGGDISEDNQAWQDCLRLSATLMGVAQEAWQLENQPSGCVFRGLNRLLVSVYRWRAERRKKRKPSSSNLLDYLRSAGLEERLARSCADLAGINEAQARLQLQVHELLTRFAIRHALISPADAAQTEKELRRLRNLLYGTTPA